jgi:hypothetical protein
MNGVLDCWGNEKKQPCTPIFQIIHLYYPENSFVLKELIMNKILAAILITIFFTVPVFAQDESELAKKTQNPVSDLISVPFQNNFNFNVGPDNEHSASLSNEFKQ